MRATPSQQVLFRELDGESVLLDLRSQKYFGLDEVGTRIWQLLDELRDVEAVQAALLDEFEVAPERLRRDLRSLLDQLAADQLIELETP